MINSANNNYISFNAKIRFRTSTKPKQTNYCSESYRLVKIAGQNFVVNAMGLMKLLVAIKSVLQRLNQIKNSVKIPS